MRHWLMRCAAIGLVLGLAASCAKKEQTAKEAITGEPTKVVAKVNGDPIRLSEVNRVVQAWRAGNFPSIDRNAPEAKLQHDAVDNLINQRLLIAAARAGGLEPDSSVISQQMDQIRSRFPDPAAFQQVLQQQGMTESDVRDGIRIDMTINAFIKTAFTDTIKVTPDQAKRYYDTHPQEFELAHARHILVRVPGEAAPETDAAAKSKADALLAELKGGADFAAVAMRASEDGSAQSGGDLGMFPRGQMVAPFDSVVFALPVGQLSDLVRTPFGYHIIKVEERRSAEFDQVATGLMTQLRRNRNNELVEAFLEKSKKSAKISRDI